jgi:methyl-accepting chemotaxis protein
MENSSLRAGGAGLFGSLTVRGRLLAGFSITIALAVVLGLSGIVGLSSQSRSMRSVDASGVANLASHRIENAVNQAEHSQAEFRLSAESKLLGETRDALASARLAITDLEQGIWGSQLRNETKALAGQVESYARQLESLSGLVNSIGDDDSGTAGEARKAAHEIESALGTNSADSLMISLLQLRRHEKDFLARRVRTYADRFDAEAAKFQRDLPASGLSRALQDSLSGSLGKYQAAFQRTVDLVTRREETVRSMDEDANRMRTGCAAILERTDQLENQVLEQAAQTQATVSRVIVGLMLVIAAVSLLFAVYLSNRMAGSIRQLAGEAEAISAGDLRERALQLEGRDELSQLARTFERMRGNLRGVLGQLQGGVGNLTSTASEIGATAKQSAASATQQAATVAELSTTADEISQTSKAASSMARDVVQAAEQAVATGERGQDAIEHGVALMQTIEQRVDSLATQILALAEKNAQINEIVDAVNDLAEQSNLLAVNASIEAAKAGEQGRGFAVVASEVRDLAEQSKRATQQIRALLGEIEKATGSAVAATEDGRKCTRDGREAVLSLRDVIRELAAALDSSNDKASQISGTAAQQASGIAQVSRALEDIRQAGHDAASGAKQLEVSVGNIDKLARDLEEIVSSYQVN